MFNQSAQQGRSRLGKDFSSQFLSLFVGLALILSFLALASLAPQVGNQFGSLSTKKQSQTALAVSTPPPCDGYGDVDLDGDVDMVDGIKISRFVAELETPTQEQRRRADVDADGQITMVDYLKISRYVAGLDLTFPVCIDHDKDGFIDVVETYIGTNPYQACPKSLSDAAWPPDFNNNKKVDIIDVGAIRPYFNSKVGQTTYSRRFDLDADGKIENSDVGLLRSYFSKTCTVSGAPTLNFTVNGSAGTSIVVDGQVTLSWRAANAVLPCNASGDWAGQRQTSGQINQTLSSIKTYTFTLTCYGPGGTVTKSVTATTKLPPLYQPSSPGDMIILDLYPEHLAILNDAGGWAQKLNDAYLAYWDLVGQAPFAGEKIAIKEVATMPDNLGAEMLADNPILWLASLVPERLRAINDHNDLSFGPIHEIGHTFDFFHAAKYYFGSAGPLNAEQWANFKLTYVADTLAVKYPTATFRLQSDYNLLGSFSHNAFVETAAMPYLASGNLNWQTMSSDAFTGLLYMLREQYGWEPFKKTFREYATLTLDRPSDDLAKIQLFVDILNKYTPQDVKPQFRSWGFPLR